MSAAPSPSFSPPGFRWAITISRSPAIADSIEDALRKKFLNPLPPAAVAADDEKPAEKPVEKHARKKEAAA